MRLAYLFHTSPIDMRDVTIAEFTAMVAVAQEIARAHGAE